tara:strand:- start:3388 stop:3552 length:165 start_codon:yes stop_codon:yes gene_type:complete
MTSIHGLKTILSDCNFLPQKPMSAGFRPTLADYCGKNLPFYYFFSKALPLSPDY